MRFTLLFMLLLGCIGISAAGARIAFDTNIVSTPFVIIEETKSVTADFTFHNTGDANLKIYSIHAGCPCVSLQYDSLVKPGAHGHVLVAVSVVNFKSGKAMIVLDVESNTENDSIVRLGINTWVRSVVSFEGRYITFNASRGEKEKTITILSPKKDLKVASIYFQPKKERTNMENWQNIQSLPVAFRWLPTHTYDEQGYRHFSCVLQIPDFDKSHLGTFTFVTNHSQKSELTVPGTLLK